MLSFYSLKGLPAGMEKVSKIAIAHFGDDAYGWRHGLKENWAGYRTDDVNSLLLFLDLLPIGSHILENKKEKQIYIIRDEDEVGKYFWS